MINRFIRWAGREAVKAREQEIKVLLAKYERACVNSRGDMSSALRVLRMFGKEMETPYPGASFHADLVRDRGVALAAMPDTFKFDSTPADSVQMYTPTTKKPAHSDPKTDNVTKKIELHLNQLQKEFKTLQEMHLSLLYDVHIANKQEKTP